jgi:hypothetical protein
MSTLPQSIREPTEGEPDPNCEFCHGTGVVYDWVPYGSTNVPMPSACECAFRNEPQEYDLHVDENFEAHAVPRTPDEALPYHHSEPYGFWGPTTD